MPHVFEPAPTGRAKCRGCHEPIARGAWRIRLVFYEEGRFSPAGFFHLACRLVVLYLVPQTSVLAAIVMTGYLGGTVATHLRIADTVRAAIPLVVGILAWGGLYLRDSRIRQLVPFRRSAGTSRVRT